MGKPRGIGEQIIQLSNKGLNYTQIKDKLKCSKATISYHLSKGGKDKLSAYKAENRGKFRICKKVETFINCPEPSIIYKAAFKKTLIKHKISRFNRNQGSRMTFTYKQLMEKMGENPVCYLTGKVIDIEDTASWHLDHIIPRSRGGENTLENCGITTSAANFCKHDMTPEELFQICKDILQHNGYEVKEIVP